MRGNIHLESNEIRALYDDISKLDLILAMIDEGSLNVNESVKLALKSALEHLMIIVKRSESNETMG